jgi:hypothetical protein
MKFTKKILGNLLLAFLIPFSVLAQVPTQTIRGVVKDRDSKIPLEGVTIVLKNTDPLVGAVTDAEGNFVIPDVPIGKYDLRITYIGYESIDIPNIVVGSGKEVVLPIEISESIEMLEGVEVTAAPRNPFALVSKIAFSMKEAKQYAGSFNDPSRIVTTTAGVVGGGGADDVENEIIIRGNSPRGLLWRLEGIEVPSPNHFTDQGASSGSISILSSNMLANSEFYTGAFPSEYGNALSGVFDIKLRKGNEDKTEYALRAGVIGLDASVEGPFKKGKDASYLLNYRYSTLTLLNDIGIELVDNALPVFQDIAFNVFIPSKKLGDFSIFGIGGLSKETEFTEGTLSNGETGKIVDESFSSDLGVIGLKHNYIINKKTFIENIFSFSANQITFNRAVPNNEGQFVEINNEDFVDKTARFSTMLNHKFNARHLLRTGVIYSRLGYDLLSQSFNINENGLVDDVNESGSTSTLQGYVAWKYRVSKKIVLNTGLHFMHFFLNNNNSIEPRLGAKWLIDDKQSLSMGIGLHSRREDLATYLSSVNLGNGLVGSNRQLGFSKAMHYVVGYQRVLSESLQLKVEAYYQDLFNIPVVDNTFFSILNTKKGFTSFDLINKGTGENYGIEITLAKRLDKNYYFNTNLSLFESKYVGGNGLKRNTLYNGNFIANILGGREFILSTNKTLNLNMRGVYAGGQRFIPIDLEQSIEQGRTIFSLDNIYEDRLENYFRADFQASYTVNLPKKTLELRLEIQNITNTENVREIIYSPITESIEEVRRGQLIPVFSVQVKF